MWPLRARPPPPTLRNLWGFAGGFSLRRVCIVENPAELWEPNPAFHWKDPASRGSRQGTSGEVWGTSGNWRVPNPPGANPLVAERAFPTSDYWGRTGLPGVQKKWQESVGISNRLLTPCHKRLRRLPGGPFSYQGVSTRGVRHSPGKVQGVSRSCGETWLPPSDTSKCFSKRDPDSPSATNPDSNITRSAMWNKPSLSSILEDQLPFAQPQVSTRACSLSMLRMPLQTQSLHLTWALASPG